MKKILSCALAQCNPLVADCAGNVARALDWIEQAARAGADVIVFPELMLSGYPPEDLLCLPDFVAAHEAAWQNLLLASKNMTLTIVIGRLEFAEGKTYNAATVIQDGAIIAHYRKRKLPNFGVFDERRYFDAGDVRVAFEIKGVACSVVICEDVWHTDIMSEHRDQDLVFVINASPYHRGKLRDRQDAIAKSCAHINAALVYVNQVGGQDELVFDGQSFVRDQAGLVTRCAPLGVETMALAHYEAGTWRVDDGVKIVQHDLSDVAQDYQALVLGLQDYARKNHFTEVVLGLSGGVDSALVLALAVDALGADKVHTVMMPSPYTASISEIDATEIAHNFGVAHQTISISACFDGLQNSLLDAFKGRAADVTEENLQARIRGTLLMALSNKFSYLLLATGNKSELAMGYCTLYGDMNGGFAPIKDVLKTDVYALCAYRNQGAQKIGGAMIPERILTRAPSAELRPNQTDQDSLPPYEILDGIIRAWMEHKQSVAAMVAQGYDEALVLRIVRAIGLNEYKRRQGVIGTRISRCAFGRDWRMPQTKQQTS